MESATQRFIEKAIEGGWTSPWVRTNPNTGDYYYSRCEIEVLLESEAWKAVGKVEGWGEYDRRCASGCGCEPDFDFSIENGNHPGAGCVPEPDYFSRTAYWRGLIDALAEGKTIEEYLSTIL